MFTDDLWYYSVCMLLRVSDRCIILWSPRWQCATSRKVAGSIPDGGTSTAESASKRNECREYFLGCKGGQCLGLTNVPPSCEIVLKSGNLKLLELRSSAHACTGVGLIFKWEPDDKDFPSFE